MNIDFKVYDKAQVLAVLYNHARPQGVDIIQYNPAPMSVDEARDLLQEETSFDYYKGRSLQIDLSGDTLDTTFYDQDNGDGAAERAISTLGNPQ